MKKILPKIFILLMLSFALVPVFSFAQDVETTPTDQGVADLSSPEGGVVAACPATGCGFKQLLETVNKVVKYILLNSLYIAALMFAYAGFILITAGSESAEAKGKAKKIIIGVLIGICCIAGCYIVIRLILTTLGYKYLGFIF